MISVPDSFRQHMAENTYFRAKASIVLTDGTSLELDEDKFNLTGNVISDSSGVSTFPLGEAICRSITLSIDNNDEAYSDYEFYGAVILLYLKYEEFTPIQMGMFTVSEPATYGDSIKLSAYDDMWKANKTYTTDLNFASGQSLRQIFIDACLTCGLMIGSTTFRNNDYVVYNKPVNATFREVFGYIAMIAGGNARISTSGYVEIIEYKFPSVDVGAIADDAVADENIVDNVDEAGTVHGYHGAGYTLENWKNLSVDTDDISITGIAMKDSHGDEVVYGASGYVIEVDNPLVFEDEEHGLELIGANIVNKPFRKFNGTHIAFPIAEFMDCVVVKDRKGNVYGTVLTDVDFTYLGFTEFANSAETKIRNRSKQSDKLSKALEEADAKIAAERAAREAAITAEQTARAAAIAVETAAREQAISQETSARETAISQEAQARESAISAEETARQQAISAEQTARENAISQEASDRAAAITAEQTARSEAISAEATARETADSNEKTARQNADSAEATTRANADTAEAQARANGDAAERSAREVAVANLNASIAGATGMYTSSDVLSDGSTVWYLHNRPTKAQSTVIIKVNAEAIALSTDGGLNYLYGLRMNGDAITRILSTEGLNADWINAGALTIRDSNNNILFQADMDSNSVTISGNCVTIGNRTASGVAATVDELSGYITYDGQKLTIGKEGWATQFVLSNDQIAAYLDGEIVSFWNVNEQKTPKQLTIPVGGNLRLGDFQWTPRSTGNVSLLWVGN